MDCRVEFDYQAQEPDELTLKKGDVISNVVTKMDGWWEGTLNGKRGMFPDNFVKVITSEKPGPSENKTTGSAGDEGSSTTVNFRKNSAGNIRRLKALYSYSPEQDDELSLAVGDIIDFVSEVEEGWWKGQLKGRTGIFPSNFVEDVKVEGQLLTDAPDNKLTTKEVAKSEPSTTSDQKKSEVIVKDSPDVIPVTRPSVQEEPAPKLPPKPIRETARCFYNYTAQNEDELSMKEGDIVYIISRECEDDGWWKGELRGKVGVFPDNFVKIITPNEPTPPSGSFTFKITAQERSIGNVSKQEPPVIGLPKKELSRECQVAEAVLHNKIQKMFEREDTQTEKDNATSGKGPNFPPKKTKEAPAVPAPPKTAGTPTSPASPFGAFLPRLYERSENGIIRSNSRGRSLEKELGGAEEFNSVERGQPLNHPTANRAKPPKRRPPSSPNTRDSDPGVLNGLSHGDLSLEPSMNHTSVSDSSANISVADNPPADLADTSASQPAKETAKESGPTTISKPKMVVPWITELKKKQDRKQVPTPNTAQSSPPNTKDNVDTGVAPHPQPIATRAPPLPVKPSLPPFPNASSLDRDRPTAHSPTAPSAQANATNNGYGHTSIQNAPSTKNVPNVASKFGGFKKDGISNHLNTSGDGVSPDLTKEFVSVEDYNALKEKVTALESELELVKRQLKVALERDFSKGHVV